MQIKELSIWQLKIGTTAITVLKMLSREESYFVALFLYFFKTKKGSQRCEPFLFLSKQTA
jgi:hypothetical protein